MNESHGVETQHGFINGWFDPGAVQYATVKCILSDQMNKQQNEQISRETVQVGGSRAVRVKRFVKRKLCVCYEGNVKCYSSNHNPASCSDE